MKHKPIDQYKVELKEVPTDSTDLFQKINCPSCHNEVSATDININDKIAKCQSCNVVFPFHQSISNFINLRKPKQEVIKPEGIDIFYFNDEMDITLQQPYGIIEIVSIILLPIFIFLTTVLFLKGKIDMYYPAFTWLLGFLSIANLINSSKHKIHIGIDSRHLFIERRPKKFIKDKVYAINEIDQIYTKKLNGLNAVYMIVNGVDGQKHVKLIEQLDSLSKARYLEQEIEKHLGIVDREIPEET